MTMLSHAKLWFSRMSAFALCNCHSSDFCTGPFCIGVLGVKRGTHSMHFTILWKWNIEKINFFLSETRLHESFLTGVGHFFLYCYKQKSIYTDRYLDPSFLGGVLNITPLTSSGIPVWSCPFPFPAKCSPSFWVGLHSSCTASIGVQSRKLCHQIQAAQHMGRILIAVFWAKFMLKVIIWIERRWVLS